MSNMDYNLLEIEEREKEVLLKLGWLFKNSLNEFSTFVDRSLGYLDKIVLPTIMASKEDKSYNPFSEIIEKYVIHILIHKLEKEGYKLLPLGYSADLTFEGDDHILNIDVKTANLDNPSDFRETVNMGINQLTHVAKLPIERNRYFPSPFFVYPTIPPYYRIYDTVKLVLTYGLLFIYPPYSDLVREVRQDYKKLLEFFRNKVRKILLPILVKTLGVNEKTAMQLLEKRPESSRYTREEIIVENILRGIFIHEHEREKLVESLGINPEEKRTIEAFSEKLKKFADKLRERDVKPIAIVAISIPNGLLKDVYLDKFVSGKNYGRSARYHYEDGVFEVLKKKKGVEIPRVLFLSVNEKYVGRLKRYFTRITVLDFQLRRL